MIPLEYEGSIIVAILEMNKASISQAFYSITFYVVHDKVFTTACDGCSMDLNKVSLIHDLGTKHGCDSIFYGCPYKTVVGFTSN